MNIGVDDVRRFLLYVNERQVQIRVFTSLEDIKVQLSHDDPTLNDVLLYVLWIWVRLCSSLTRYQQGVGLGQYLWTENSLKTHRKRLFLLIQLIIYFQNRERTVFMSVLWFLLHYRGLTNTGFSILHYYGVGPSISSLPAIWIRVIGRAYDVFSYNGVLWCDNLRRLLKGFVRTDYNVDWTVSGVTLLECVLPVFNFSKPAVGNLFSSMLIQQVKDDIRTASEIDFMAPNTYYSGARKFAVPLRVEDAIKYQFIEDQVHPFACGTVTGTALLLGYVKQKLLQDNKYGLCVLDYDLYWRTMKFYHTDSLSGAFKTCRDQLILIMGPWHIYKLLAQSVWDTYAAVFFAPIWIKVKKKRCPAIPDLPDIITFFVCIALAVKEKEMWNPRGGIARSICMLIYKLIPLVSPKSLKLQWN